MENEYEPFSHLLALELLRKSIIHILGMVWYNTI